ncbi:neprilysin-4-like [Ixodes scapularis]|uniref:neprilysin-4-like n=1 Tax=Ixodes scapularis TaxID=6945 RepID=UPI001C384CE4|nr:neprilysin-4-like [Ixodes scapularis]
MKRSTPWSSRQKYMLPHARQLVAIWGFYLILLLAELSAAKSVLDLPPKNMCETEACKERAKIMLDSMNQTVDPCTNFYEYACGNWKKTHKIPDHWTKFGYRHILHTKLQMGLKNILLNATLKEEEPQNATNKAILAYRVCLCETLNETAKFNDLLQLLKEDGFTKWPLLNKGESPYENYTQLLNQSTFLPFVSFYVSQDYKNPHSNAIYLDQITFDWVGRNELINHMAEENKKIIVAFKKVIASTAKVFRPNLTEEEAEQFSEDMLQFEVKLAKHTKAGEDRRNLSSMYNEMNISTLSEKYPKIEWLKLLNHEFAVANMTLNESERVIVLEPDYVKDIQKILEEENISTLYNFVHWITIRTYGADGSKELDKLFLNFDKEATGVKKEKPLWMQCLSGISDLMTHAISRLYVDKMFDPKAKKTMDELVGVLNSTYGEMIENNTWMDNSTRKEAREKLQKMVAKIGYPPWILNDTYLNGLYEYAPAIFLNYSYLIVRHGLNLNIYIQELLTLRKRYKKEDEWFTGATETNAFYGRLTNDILFPAAILQPPYFQDGVPSSINMGAIGMFIGHEITHGFDNGGSQFDGDGELRNWWTESSAEEFVKRAQCFIDQYSNVTVKEVNLTLNGINTQGENIADNSGLRAAYLAFRKFNDTDEVLPGLNLTGDQLFFLSNAMVRCENISAERLRYDIQYDPHSPAKYRVNLPMGTSPDFLRVFSCSPNSSMTITNKCTMW